MLKIYLTSDQKIQTLLLAGGYKGHLNSKNIQYGGITVQPSSNSPRAKEKTEPTANGNSFLFDSQLSVLFKQKQQQHHQ